MKILMLFFDGLGLGEDREGNPLSRRTPLIYHLLEGQTMTRSTAPYHGRYSTLLSADSSLDWPGRPQSATGQTALFTGVNPVPMVRGHKRGLPDAPLKKILEEESIFVKLKRRGIRSTFANAYRPSFFEKLEKGEESSFSVTTVMVHRAGLPFRSFNDLKRGEALYCDIDHALLKESGYLALPRISPYEAGRRLAFLAERYLFTLFESFLTDRIGHAQESKRAREMVETLDSFLKGILSSLDLRETLLLLTSDHGNFEDLHTPLHTENPVPVLMLGAGRERLKEMILGIETITPALLNLFHTT